MLIATRGNAHRIVRRRLFSATWLLWLPLLALMCVAAEQRPVVAVVTTSEKTGFEDLLLAELASRESFRLVERDELWRTQQELATEAGFRNALQLAARVKAHGLLIVAGGKGKSVRLVETTRGVVLAQWDLGQAEGEADEAARRLADALSSHGARLLVPAEAKLFVSMRPHRPDDLDHADSLLFSRLNSLVAFNLSRDPSTFLVERENFAAVTEEADPGAAPAGPWQAADAIVNIKMDREKVESLRCVYQVRGSRAGSLQARAFEVDYASLEKTVESIVSFLREALLAPSHSSAPGRIRLRHEAALYHYMATTAAAHHGYPRALPFLELACLLCPEEAAWRTEFVHVSLKHLAKNACGNWNASSRFSEGQYMEYIHWLRQAVGLQMSVDRASSVRALLSQVRPFRFMTRDVRGFQARNCHMISCLRAELRALLPLVAGGRGQDVGARDISWFASVAPVFFDAPQSAIASLRGLMACKSFPVASLRDNIYLRVNYWDRGEAQRLWFEMLSELGRSEDVEKQATYHIGRCFFHGAFDQYVYRSSDLPAARDAALGLFRWMDATPAAREWMTAKETWYVHLRLWFALRALPVEQQDDYYRRLLLPLVKRRPSEKSNAMSFANFRWFWNLRHKHKPDDAPAIRRHIRDLHEARKSTEGESFSEWLKPHLTRQWVVEVFADKRAGGEFAHPEIPNGRLLFDSGPALGGGPRQKRYCFDGFGAHVDGQVLWAAWAGESEIGLVRVDLESKDVGHFLAPVGVRTSASIHHPFRVTRVRDSLYVAGTWRIYAIPLRDGLPVCDPGEVRTLGPKIGAHQLGVTFATRPDKSVSALAGCGEHLYFALNQPIADGRARNLYGAIYRWDGRGTPELLTASDSLLNGPLNNCLPYDVFAAFPDSTGQHVYFLLDASAGQPRSKSEGQRNGIWHYSVKTGAWRQVVHRDFDYPAAGLSLARMTSPDSFDFGDHGRSFRFVLSAGKLQRGLGQAASPNMASGFAVKYSREGDAKGHNFLCVTARSPRGERLFRTNCAEFYIRKAMCWDDGIYILLSALQPGGLAPTNRGLVYFVPYAHH